MSQGCFLEGQSSHLTPPSEKESLLNNNSSLTRFEGLNMATIVIGAQWGDEGKGKLTDILSTTVKLCASTYPGSNFLPIRECLLSRHVLEATTSTPPQEEVIANSLLTKRSTRREQRWTHHVPGSQNSTLKGVLISRQCREWHHLRFPPAPIWTHQSRVHKPYWVWSGGSCAVILQ
jgi:hypothetical protein